MRKQNGITLIELMIVIVVVAILASIALPSYQNSVMRSKRVPAEGDLYAMRNAMQRFFSENNTYVGAAAGAFPSAPLAAVFASQSPIDADTPAYNLEITAAGASTFALRAVPINGQQGDVCGTLTLNSQNVRGVSSSTVANCW